MAGVDEQPTFGLDTSVVLRLLTGLPEDQASAALRFVQEASEAGRTPVVSDIVVCEAYFALHAHYRVPKRSAQKALLNLLRSRSVVSEAGGSAARALEAAASGTQSPGFVHRLIHEQYRRLGVALVTFEKASAKLRNAVLLAP